MGMPGVIKAMALGIQAQVAKVVSSWRKDDLFGADILAAYDKLADKAKGDRGQQPLPAHGSPVTGGDSNISLPSAGSMEGAFLHHPPRSTPYPVVFRIALKVVLAFAWCVFISSREARPWTLLVVGVSQRVVRRPRSNPPLDIETVRQDYMLVSTNLPLDGHGLLDSELKHPVMCEVLTVRGFMFVCSEVKNHESIVANGLPRNKWVKVKRSGHARFCVAVPAGLQRGIMARRCMPRFHHYRGHLCTRTLSCQGSCPHLPLFHLQVSAHAKYLRLGMIVTSVVMRRAESIILIIVMTASLTITAH
jgi:hypothetical protein